MLVSAYDFGIIKTSINQIIKNAGNSLKELHITISAKAPSLDGPLIERFTAEGKVKSYQKKEICVKLRDLIKNGWNNSIQSSINRFARLKDSIEITVKVNFQTIRKISESCKKLRKSPKKYL